jgi:hypothetical protein
LTIVVYGSEHAGIYIFCQLLEFAHGIFLLRNFFGWEFLAHIVSILDWVRLLSYPGLGALRETVRRQTRV